LFNDLSTMCNHDMMPALVGEPLAKALVIKEADHRFSKSVRIMCYNLDVV